MKECLVIAFVLTLTGTVAGQQSSRSVFEGSRTDSSRATSAMGQGEAGASERIMKLDIDSEMIDAIQEGQTLEASIELKDVTNGIVMFWDDPKTIKPRLEDVPRNLKPNFKSGNGVLHFTLDETGLQRLKTEGLQYSYDPTEKGAYQKVALTYVPSASAQSLPSQRLPSTMPRRSVGSEMPRTDFDHNLSQETTDRDLSRSATDRDLSRGALDRDLSRGSMDRNLSRDDFGSRRRDTNRLDFDNNPSGLSLDNRRRDSLLRSDFESTTPRSTQDPALLDDTSDADRYFQRQQELARQKELEQRRQLDFDRKYPASDTNLGRSSDRQLQSWERPRANKHTFELTDQEIDALANSTNQIRSERERQAAELERLRLEKLTSDRQTRLANADRIRLMQELRDRSTLDQTSVAQRRAMGEDEFYNSYRNRGLTPAVDRFARSEPRDTNFDATLLELTREQRATTEADRLKLQNAALENELLRTELARAQRDQDPRNYPTANQNTPRTAQLDNQNRSPLSMADFGASIPSNRTPMTNRVARANVPTQITTMSGQQLTTSVDHILRSYDGTNYDTNYENVAVRIKTEVAAMAAAKTRVDKHNGFLWFLFIMFFALSIYLGWLAQSFYSQYGELADELRETFTATT